MKLWKNIVGAAALFIGLSSSVLYTACQKDACEELSCKNGASCKDGYCNCRTGFEGTECKTKTADRFIGRYAGYSVTEGFATLADTVDVTLVANPDSVIVRRKGVVGNPGRNVIGRTIGTGIVVSDQDSLYFTRHATLLLEENFQGGTKLTYYDEVRNDSTGESRSVTNFYGKKQ